MKRKVYLLSFLTLIFFLIFFLGFRVKMKNVAPKTVDLIEALKVEAKKKNINFKTIVLTPENDILAETESGVKVFFSTEKDIEAQLVSLQKLFFRSTIKGEIKSVDLRFNKIYITN